MHLQNLVINNIHSYTESEYEFNNIPYSNTTNKQDDTKNQTASAEYAYLDICDIEEYNDNIQIYVILTLIITLFYIYQSNGILCTI